MLLVSDGLSTYMILGSVVLHTYTRSDFPISLSILYPNTVTSSPSVNRRGRRLLVWAAVVVPRTALVDYAYDSTCPVVPDSLTASVQFDRVATLERLHYRIWTLPPGSRLRAPSLLSRFRSLVSSVSLPPSFPVLVSVIELATLVADTTRTYYIHPHTALHNTRPPCSL